MTSVNTARPDRSGDYRRENERNAYRRGFSRGCLDGMKSRRKVYNDGPDADPYRRGYADGYAAGLTQNPSLPPPPQPRADA